MPSRSLAGPRTLLLLPVGVLVGLLLGGCNFSFNPSVDRFDPEPEPNDEPELLDAGLDGASQDATEPPLDDAASLLCDSGCARVVCPGCDGGEDCGGPDACVERCQECDVRQPLP
jgi:hypothetical protein